MRLPARAGGEGPSEELRGRSGGSAVSEGAARWMLIGNGTPVGACRGFQVCVRPSVGGLLGGVVASMSDPPVRMALLGVDRPRRLNRK
jgi:hypothetical protein